MRSLFNVVPSVPRRHTLPVHVHAFVPTLALVLLAACTRSSPGSGAAAAGGLGVSARAVSASVVGGSGSRSGAVSLVSCSGNSCSVTLSGSGSLVHILGTTFGVAEVDGNRPTLRVDGRDVTCPVGQGVSVGALRLTCTATTDDAVTFTVVRG